MVFKVLCVSAKFKKIRTYTKKRKKNKGGNFFDCYFLVHFYFKDKILLLYQNQQHFIFPP